MPQPWTVDIATFSGRKFAIRYGLDPQRPDFTLSPLTTTTAHLFLRPGVAIPHDPPILEPPDSLPFTTREAVLRQLTSTNATATLARALLLTVLDAVNTLRAASVPPLPAITKAQLLTALTNKLNSGQAD